MKIQNKKEKSKFNQTQKSFTNLTKDLNTQYGQKLPRVVNSQIEPNSAVTHKKTLKPTYNMNINKINNSTALDQESSLPPLKIIEQSQNPY